MLDKFWKFPEELLFNNCNEYSPDRKEEIGGVGKRLERAPESPWEGF